MAEIRINATGGVKLYDADDSHYAQIIAGTITSNVNAITLGHDVVSIVDNLALTSDSAVLKFGADSEITLTHSADSGLLLKHTATTDDKPINLVLQTGETDMAADDVIGKISFQAPDEGTGTDAVLVSGAIQAVAEGDHSSSSNATRLEFMTGASEAATTKMSVSSGGIVGIGAVPTGDLGVGLHIKTADSSASVLSGADELVLENSADCGLSILSDNDDYGQVVFGDDGDNDIGKIRYNHGNNSMDFHVNAAERMRIDSSGNLLVGTTSTTINVSNFGLKIASSGIISSSANVDGASTATEHFGNAGYIRFMGDGDAENSNNSYGALSDERLKENITDANSQWNDIKELQIKNYNLIAYPDRTHIGVIAQDLEADNMSGLVQETKPEVEHIEIDSNFGTIEDDTDHPILDDEGNETGIYQQKVKTVNSKVKSVKYSVLYMKAIKALQESMERIEQLEAKVTALENA